MSIVILSALALIAIASATVAITTAVRTAGSRHASLSSAALQRQEAAARVEAAAWVANHVSLNAIVSCDPAMCSALRADGFPSGKLRPLGPTSPLPLTSAVVVETAAVRELFGASLAAQDAPDVLAAVGSGDAGVSIRVIARYGSAVYHQTLAADLASRESDGVALLQAGVITVSPLARKQLTTGQVDSRLVLALANLAAAQQIDIVQFGNVGSGASAELPLRFADLATTDPAGNTNGSQYVQSLLARLKTGPGAHPGTMNTGVLPGDQSVLRVEFFAPSPLGLGP